MAVRRYWDGNIPWLTAKDLKSFSLSTSQMMVTEEGAKAGSRIAPAGSVLLLVRGMTLFKDVPIGVARRDLAFGQDLKALEPKDGVLGNFLAWKLFSSKHLLMQLVDTAGHGTGRLSTERLADLPISLPPQEEQFAIVELLDEVAGAVTSAETLVKKKIVAKAALAEELLTGRRRFPGFTAPWRKQKLGELFREIGRYEEWDDSATYTLLSVRRRSGGLFGRAEMTGAEILTKVMKTVRADDFLISKMQVVHGAWARVTKQFDGAHVSDSYICLVPVGNGRVDPRFFDQLSRLPFMYRLALRSSYGVHIEKMTFRLDLFLKESIELPELDEQRRIAEFLEMLDEEITLLHRQRDLLNEQKNGLMQKLLTGEVRLKEFRS